jgi:hypothetical protein
VECQSVTQVLHDVVSISPETNNDGSTTIGKNPEWDRRLRRGLTTFPDEEDSSQGTNRIGDIVRAVSERGSSGSKDLEEGVKMLSLVIEVGSTSMHIRDVSCEGGITVLFGNNVLVDTVHERSPECLGKVLGKIPWSGISLLNIGKRSSSGRARVSDFSGEIGGSDLAFGDVPLKIVCGFEMLHVGDGGGFDVGTLEILASGMASVVILDDLNFGWRLWDGAAVEEERAEGDVVPAEGPVLLCELTVEVRNEEESDECGDRGTNSDDAASELTGFPVVDIEGWSLENMLAVA